MENKFGLSNELYSKFAVVQTKHNNAWSSSERKEQHSLENIERVEYKTSEKFVLCLLQRNELLYACLVSL